MCSADSLHQNLVQTEQYCRNSAGPISASYLEYSMWQTAYAHAPAGMRRGFAL